MVSVEIACPVTGEFCPHLSLLESQKDESSYAGEFYVKDSLGLEPDFKIKVDMQPYEAQDFTKRVALSNPEFCTGKKTSACGVIIAAGLEL